MNNQATPLNLPFGLTFADLYHREGLIKIDHAFLDFLTAQKSDLVDQCILARQGEICDESALLISLAPLVDQFIGALFDEEAANRLRQEHKTFGPILEVNRQFVQRIAI